MVDKIKLVLVSVLLTFASGCANKPVFTVELYQTPTPFPMATELPTLTAGPLPIFPPSPTSAPILNPAATIDSEKALMSPDFSPILYGRKYDASTFFTLLGGVQAGKWLTPEEASAQFSGDWDYDVHTLASGSFQVHAFAPEFSPVNQGYFLGTNANLDEIGMVGVLHGWPVQKRDVRALSPDSENYRRIVLDWLKNRGIAAPQLKRLSIFRVDLEGDGTDEIFISATNLDESQHGANSGDYSIILLRKVVENDAMTLSLMGDVYLAPTAPGDFPRTYSLANFIDLNQDGILEVVVDFQRWEGDGALVYQIDGQEIIQLFGE
jgi:hypothetical protein